MYALLSSDTQTEYTFIISRCRIDGFFYKATLKTTPTIGQMCVISIQLLKLQNRTTKITKPKLFSGKDEN